MLNLNIEMQSFNLDENIIGNNDSLRISVTTIPGQQKQAFSFYAHKLKIVKPFFSVKIDEKTEKILVVIRKKSFTERDPIIASTVIQKTDFPTKLNNIINTELKTINLLEPVQHIDRKNSKSSPNRKVIGKFDVQFSIDQDIPTQTISFLPQICKNKNTQGYSNLLTNNENSIFDTDQIAF